MLINVMLFVRRSEDLGFIDVIHADLLENLGFGKMSDAALGHYWNRDGIHDLADLLNRGHASDAAFRANLRRNTLQGHDGDSASTFGDQSLLSIGDVHNDAAFEHLC